MEFYYSCSECGKIYDIIPERMVCDICRAKQEPEKPLKGVLEVHFRQTTGEKTAGVHLDIHSLVPVEERYFPPIPVGNTPLWEPKNLRVKTGFPNLFIKDDTANPTGSYKDRASFLVAGFALKHKIKEIAVASTGNAASSMAGVGAAAGLKVTIFLPEFSPKAKMVQALQFGAKVNRVRGTYGEAYRLSLEYSQDRGILSRNTAYNPLTIEGKKSSSLEIFNQLGGKMPDYVFVPVGDGVILGGVYKGFEDLIQLGLTDRIPVIYAVQAEGSSAISRAKERGDFESPVKSTTLADSISVEVPANGYYALKKLNRHGGKCLIVSDSEILKAQKELSATTGLFAEPAAAASLAGFLKEKDKLRSDATVVLMITGTGLKDIESAMKALSIR